MRSDAEGMRISVITAAHPSGVDHLEAAAASISNCMTRLTEAGTGVTLEWIVVIDGPDRPGESSEVWDQIDWPAGSRVLRTSEHGGVAVARNIGVAHATGDWVFPLDADDLLDPQGFFALVHDPVLTDPTVGWVSANRLLVDGGRTRHWISEGRFWEPGELAEAWRSPFPFHANCLLARTDLLAATGGWPAMIANEDLGCALTLSEEARGASTVHVAILYRTWENQTTAQDWFAGAQEEAFRFIAMSVNALRARKGRAPVTAPTPNSSPTVRPLDLTN